MFASASSYTQFLLSWPAVATVCFAESYSASSGSSSVLLAYAAVYIHVAKSLTTRM
jgi:hypothetical protein